MSVHTLSQPVQMVDLTGQYVRLKSEIDPAIQSVLNQGVFIGGAVVKRFSNKLAQFMGCDHVITCANGTDALQIAFQALNLNNDDEIIVPAFNYVAAAEAAALLQLKPVFVDVDPHTFNLNPAKVKEALTSRTKVIVPVHLFGQGVDMELIMEIADANRLFVVEDNAQAIGAISTYGKYAGKRLGTIGHIGTTSFFPSKNLGCMGDGGAIFTNDPNLASSIQMVANHGQAQKYRYQKIGVNSRLDALQAAILEVKLNHIEDFTERRRIAASNYDQALGGKKYVQIPARTDFSDHVFHQYTLTFETEELRDHVKQRLADNGIPSMIYYPKSLHLQEAYQYLGYKSGDFPVSEQLSERVLSLPMHTELEPAAIQLIASLI